MQTKPFFCLAVLTLIACAGGKAEEELPATQPAQVSPESALDGDGVQMLFPSASSGVSFRLGTSNPNDTDRFVIEKDTKATAGTDGGIHFWNVPSYPLDYSSGGKGWTSRLHVHASGGEQKYTWKTQHGYLSSPQDLKNQEFTVYVRPHRILDVPRAALTLKIRGGKHSSKESEAALGSCTMMLLAPASAGHVTRFGKELNHPTYDYVTLTPAFSAEMADDEWVGMKLVSYAQSGKVINRLYLDTAPFDRTSGKPKNGWRLFSEYVDEEGKSTGKYTKLVDWGGWQTTFRTDGIHDMDVAIFSVREIVPPG
ncbi:hypothetical protein LZC95_23285 [Pendulispora brunnea]|uniref:Uncharacterized protein n=1 Tax=Pendulispora brunnea TaxID=2905690 RepID=A0ABZ2KTU8_9BACT